MKSGNRGREIRLYNTLTRDLQYLYFCEDKIRIYLCGVTVYDESHIGHARTIIVFDVLRRYLSSKGYIKLTLCRTLQMSMQNNNQ